MKQMELLLQQQSSMPSNHSQRRSSKTTRRSSAAAIRSAPVTNVRDGNASTCLAASSPRLFQLVHRLLCPVYYLALHLQRRRDAAARHSHCSAGRSRNTLSNRPVDRAAPSSSTAFNSGARLMKDYRSTLRSGQALLASGAGAAARL